MPKSINFQEIQNIILSHKDTAIKLKRTTYKDRIKKLNSIVSYLQDKNNEQRLMEAMKIDLGRPYSRSIIIRDRCNQQCSKIHQT